MSQQTKNHLIHWMGVALFVSCFAGVLLFGRSMSSSAQSPAGDDSGFAKNAAQGGMAEVKLGELAQQKASSEAVKSFGKRMVDDHSKAGSKLKATAQSENITLPTELKAADQAAYDRLSKLSGPAFDRAYIAGMVKGHKAVAAEFRKESMHGKDSDIKAWAEKTLPTVEHHLMMATEDQKQLMVRHTSH